MSNFQVMAMMPLIVHPGPESSFEVAIPMAFSPYSALSMSTVGA